MDLDRLLKLLRSLPEEEAKFHLVEYTNKLKERLIETSWRKANNLLKFAIRNKKRQLKNFVIEMDDISLSISILDFNRFFFSVIDSIQDSLKEYDSQDAWDLAEDIEHKMHVSAGSVKLDRRMLARKDD